MSPRLRIAIVVVIGLAVAISVIRDGFDPEHPSLAYCVLMVVVLVSLISAIRSGLNRSIPMSSTSRIIRVVGGSLWAFAILAGMTIQVWKALHR